MRKLIYTCLIALTFIAIQGCEERKGKNYNNKSLVDDEDAEFINAASENGLTEIEASALVNTRSKNPRIIRFAEVLTDHHTKIEEGLQKLASENNVAYTDTLSLTSQKDIAELSKQTGPAFDQAYITMIFRGHKKAVKIFSGAMKNKKPSIKSFAEKNLHTLMLHLDSARTIKDDLE